MFVIDGHTADHDRRRRPHGGHDAATDGISFFTVAGDAERPHPHAAVDDGPDPQAGEARVLRRRRPTPLGRAGLGLGRAVEDARPGGRRASRTRWSAARRSCLDMSVEYAKVRVQFGRPIGSFQAIKHKCADMLLEVESGKSAAYYAVVGRGRGQRRAAGRREPRQGVLLRRVLPRRGREHPDPRRHRLHVGAPRAPLLQAGEELRDPARRRRRTTASCSRSASGSDPARRASTPGSDARIVA